MKKLLSLITVLFCCFLLCGCGGVKDKEFSSNGFTITLNENFYEKEIATATNYYESTTAIVTALKEEFTVLEQIGLGKDSTLEEYAQAVSTNNKRDFEFKENKDHDYVYFNYNSEVSGKNFYYMGVVKKGSDGFWLVNFACLDTDKEKLQSDFTKWADSIKVN